MSTVTLDGPQAEAVSPEGQRCSMPVADLMRKLLPPPPDTGEFVLPDGAKALLTRGNVTLLVHQTPPAVHNFKWVADDSPAPFGPGAKYRDVRLAQPYIVVFAAFQRGPGGRPMLTARNECFYRTAPMSGLSDELLFPALLNCSKFEKEEGNPLSWICTQYLDPASFLSAPDNNARMRAAFRGLMQTLLESGFNLSSEAHEGASWFTETQARKVDPRVATVERWQAETDKDPLFVLDVPWVKTGRTVAEVAERIFGLLNAKANGVKCSGDVARVIFNHK